MARLTRFFRKNGTRSKANAQKENSAANAAPPAFVAKLPKGAWTYIFQAGEHMTLPQKLSLRRVDTSSFNEEDRTALVNALVLPKATGTGGHVLTDAELDLAGFGLTDANLTALKRFNFLNSRWTSLDISLHRLTDDACTEFFRSIPFFSPLTHLVVGSNAAPSEALLTAALETVQRCKQLRRMVVCTEKYVADLDPTGQQILRQIETALGERASGQSTGQSRSTAPLLSNLPADQLARDVVSRAVAKAENMALARGIATRAVAKAVGTMSEQSAGALPRRRPPPPPPPLPLEGAGAIGESPRRKKPAARAMEMMPTLTDRPTERFATDRPFHPTGLLHAVRLDNEGKTISPPESVRDKEWAAAVRLPAAPAPATAHPTGLLHAVKLQAEKAISPPESERDYEWAAAVRLPGGTAPPTTRSQAPTARSQAPDGLVAERVSTYEPRPALLEGIEDDDERTLSGSLARKSSGAWPVSPTKRARPARAQWVSTPTLAVDERQLAC